MRLAGMRLLIALFVGGGILLFVLVFLNNISAPARHSPVPTRARAPKEASRPITAAPKLTVWWNAPAAELRTQSTGTQSNVHPANYIGPQSCRECHPGNYESWSRHPHRWMNALANDATVKGDFTNHNSINYLGGAATFFRKDGKYFMRAQRNDTERLYQITQTIGSRFFQYYVGRLVDGPEPQDHHFYAKDHVLLFGYWLALKEWVPIVHVGPEMPDGERPDPYAPPAKGRHYAEYAVGCNGCHTTFPLGDLFGRNTHQVGAHAPAPLHWSLRGYLEKAHPESIETIVKQLDKAHPETTESIVKQRDREQSSDNPMKSWDASRYAVTLGVSCEACHLGAREHVESGGLVLPRFFPASPHLSVETGGAVPDPGRNHANVNWACGRCHTGNRPQFAAGMSTWNSVEYADAMRGSCYSKLTCIDCHNPHKEIGQRWTLTPDQDDALCLKCHDRYQPRAPRQAHTHHPAGSTGARCMNCHMPHLNEGLQDVVRTHMIYSPTRPDMIRADQPNACNLCHTDRPIDWTLRYLKDWYGRSYDQSTIAARDTQHAPSAALGWAQSQNPAVRLVAVEALIRMRDRKALAHIVNALDDPYLVNRQFAYKGLQEMLPLRLRDFGYRFYMTPEERLGPLKEVRAKLLPPLKTRQE